MQELSLKKLCALLGTGDIPGSEKELNKLRIRIRELLESNGEEWVRENRQKLLGEWACIVRKGIIGN